MIRLEIPEVTISGNIWYRSHWTKRRKIRKAWDWLVFEAIAKAQLGKPFANAAEKRLVMITRHAPRTLDTDNLYAGVKPLLDALVTIGLLVDDKPAWCDLVVKQEKSKDKRTVIVVSEISGGR